MTEPGGVLDELEDFMELVTAYRCKFCDFTATTPHAIGSHVKQQHIKTTPPPEEPGETVQLPMPESDATDTVTAMPGSGATITITAGSGSTDTVTATSVNLSPDTRVKMSAEPQVLMAVDALSSVIQQSDLGLPVGSDKQTDIADEAGSQLIELASSAGSSQQVYSKSLLANISGPSTGVQTLSTGTGMSVTSADLLGEAEQLQSVSEAQALSNIQFVNEDSQGHLVAANCGHVQLGDGSTVQVLVYDSNIPQTMDAQTEPATEPGPVADDAGVGGQVEAETGTGHHGNETGDVNRLEFAVDGVEKNDFVPVENDEPMKMKEEEKSTGYEEPVVHNPGILEDGDTQTKELYLCGSCCEGFATIQECKDHMIQDHGLNDAQNSGRVDMGTQMEPKKRVGRKRKSERERIEKETEQEVEEEVIVMSDSDEDWSEQLFSYSSRSKRKRRPPSALRKDYYLGRRRAKSPKRRQETGMNVKCEVKGCVAKFRSDEKMKEHTACHIEGAELSEHQFKCVECEEKFFVWKQTRHHMWKAHKIDMDLFECEICGNFKTDTLSKLKIHCEVHGTERPYHCDVCGKGFKQFAQMKNHEHCHDIGVDPDQADKWHTPKVCDICGRTFANAKCMKKHKECVHGNHKPYKCNYCSYTCSRKAMLLQHQRIHTGEKPFKCDMCSYTCGDHNSLRRHKMRHSGHKPYKCPHCPYACIQAISLKVHVKNKHPGMGGVYNCHLCLYRTVNKQQYENHMLDHKNGLIETVVAPDGQVLYKNVNHARKPRTNTVKSEITTLAFQPDMLESLNTHTVQMANMLQPQVIEIPVSSANNTEQVAQLEMQVQMNEAGENVISAEDLAKLSNIDGMVNSDVQAAQLIYSALSAISQNGNGNQDPVNQGLVAGVENGNMQTTIQTNSEEGVTTHTITFHLPEGEDMAGNHVAVQEQADNKNVTILKVGDGTAPWPANTVFLDQAEVQNI